MKKKIVFLHPKSFEINFRLWAHTAAFVTLCTLKKTSFTLSPIVEKVRPSFQAHMKHVCCASKCGQMELLQGVVLVVE